MCVKKAFNCGVAKSTEGQNYLLVLVRKAGLKTPAFCFSWDNRNLPLGQGTVYSPDIHSPDCSGTSLFQPSSLLCCASLRCIPSWQNFPGEHRHFLLRSFVHLRGHCFSLFPCQIFPRKWSVSLYPFPISAFAEIGVAPALVGRARNHRLDETVALDLDGVENFSLRIFSQ